VSRIKATGVPVQLARPGANHIVPGDGIKPARLSVGLRGPVKFVSG
jgi:hypothetical protein